MTRPAYDLTDYTHRLAAIGPLEDQPIDRDALIAERQQLVDRMQLCPGSVYNVGLEVRLREVARMLRRVK